VVPISYDFSRKYQICDLHQSSFEQCWQAFLRETYPAYRKLCSELFQDLVVGQKPLFNWYEQIVARSKAAELTRTTSEAGRLLAQAS
jgi:hypothetical protein